MRASGCTAGLVPNHIQRRLLHVPFAVMDTNEFMESTTVRFEWTIRGLHELFESRCVTLR